MDFSFDAVSNNGERILKGDSDQLIQSHKLRYNFASNYIPKGASVVDCACGSGYGSHILAKNAGIVYGVDLSETAIQYCQSHYPADNLKFIVGSAESILLENDSVDVFCSFETIEHIPHPEKLISEAHRILKPHGVFLVSTPNRIVTGLKKGERHPNNPFHLIEWSFLEFNEILTKQFTKIEYYGQRIKSVNKFHLPYITSKFKRLIGRADLMHLDGSQAQMLAMENEKFWQPVNFLAVCRK